MSISVLPQLLEVDSELSAQAASLEAQLSTLQEKRKGIQTVIAMFESGDSPSAATVAAVASGTKSKTTKSTKRTKSSATKTKSSTAKSAATKSAAKSKAAKAKKTAVKEKVDASTKTKTRKVKATRGRPAKAKTNKVSASAAKKGPKRSGRTANWQKYVQENYSKAALPDVIVGVLKAQPDSIFKIADVMNVVFKEDMPKTHFLKARNRVSNILSAGARDGEWYRGRGGTYSVSEKAIKAVG